MVVILLMQKALNFNDVAIASVKGSDYRIRFWYLSKDDAINIIDSSEKKLCVIIFFIIYKKYVNAIPLKQLIIKLTEMLYLSEIKNIIKITKKY